MNAELQPPSLRFNDSTEPPIGDQEPLPAKILALDPGQQGEERIPDNHVGTVTRQSPARRRWQTLGNAVSRRLWRLDSEDLCTAARRRTGLKDYGAPQIEPALSILVKSLEQEADLHPLGRFLMRMHIRDLLGKRLRLSDAWSRQRETFDASRIERPVFIIGMPRTGSTF